MLTATESPKLIFTGGQMLKFILAILRRAAGKLFKTIVMKPEEHDWEVLSDPLHVILHCKS